MSLSIGHPRAVAAPVSTPKSAAREAPWCDLCGEPLEDTDLNRAAYEASGWNVCTRCLEEML